jgi:AcrR family transcriptional regulator
VARRTGSDGARTEEAIRIAAVTLIAEHGFEAMTLRELARRVGVQPGALYRYFPSKRALLVTLLHEHLDFLLEQWALQAPAAAPPQALLAAFVAFHIRYHTLRTREVFVANMELRSLLPEDRPGVVALRKKYERILIAILRGGKRAGVFHVPDEKVAAFAILAMLTGVGGWYRESGRLSKTGLIRIYTRLVMQCVRCEIT